MDYKKILIDTMMSSKYRGKTFDELKSMFISEENSVQQETDAAGMTIANNNGVGQFIWDFDKMEGTECNTFVTNYVYGYREMRIDVRR